MGWPSGVDEVMPDLKHGDLVEVEGIPGVIWEIESFRFDMGGDPSTVCLRFWGSDKSVRSPRKENELWCARLNHNAIEVQRNTIKEPNAMLLLALATKKPTAKPD
jgi:hypothetical protein